MQTIEKIKANYDTNLNNSIDFSKSTNIAKIGSKKDSNQTVIL